MRGGGIGKKSRASFADDLSELANGRLTGDVLMLAIMKEYGWDFNTYMAQPAWLLELAARKLDIEAKLALKAAEDHA